MERAGDLAISAEMKGAGDPAITAEMKGPVILRSPPK
jgi:hypothetical protein